MRLTPPVGQDPVDHGRGRDERDDTHRLAALGTAERVNLEDAAEQRRPAPARLGLRRWQHVGGVPPWRGAEQRFTCGPAGTLLVQRVRPLRQLGDEELSRIRRTLGRPPGGPEWDVFDREGRYLGVVDVPGTEWVAVVPDLRFVQDQASGTWYMYSVWSDELEVRVFAPALLGRLGIQSADFQSVG